MDKLNFAKVYYKIGEIRGYSSTLRNRVVGQKIMDKIQELENEMNLVLGFREFKENDDYNPQEAGCSAEDFIL
jgi:hypothetical protein